MYCMGIMGWRSMTFGMRGGVLCFWDIMGWHGCSDILG